MPDDGLFVWYKVLALVLGGVFGSFAALVVYRLPRGESIVRPASRCPGCQTPIRWHDNLPILGYVLVGGRCRACRTPISLRYPLIELLLAVLSLACLLLGASRVLDSLTPWVAITVWFFPFVFCWLLITATFIDLEHLRIPHVLTLVGIVCGLVAAAVGGNLTGVSLTESLLGLVAGALPIVVLIEVWFRVFGREGMGYGDAMLMGMVGATLGWQAIPFVLMAASLQGILISLPAWFKARRRPEGTEGMLIPFGPFITLGALEWMFFSEAILDRISGLLFWTAAG